MRARRALPLVLLVCLATACGGMARQLGPALEATRAARDGLALWSEQAQAAIVAAAPTEEIARAHLAAHRKQRDKAVRLLTVAQAALAVALAAPTAEHLAAAVKAVTVGYEAVRALEGGGS